MAIALNRGNAHSTRSSLKSIARVGQTPAASVWEPAVREPRVNRVRTLDSVARTHNETLSNGRVLSSLLRLLNLWVAGKAFEATWLSVLCSVRQYFLAFYSLALMPQMSQ